MGKKKVRSRVSQADKLFETVIHRAKQAGDFDSVEPILDYCRPCVLVDGEKMKVQLNMSKFSFLPCLTFGPDGKLYLNCYLTRFNGLGYYSVRIGTLRTLTSDMDTCKIMGELCGALIFHARQHLNEQQYRRSDSSTIMESQRPKHRRVLIGTVEES